MNTREHTAMKMKGNPDIFYLGHTVDRMIWSLMEQEKIDRLTLAIVQAPYILRVAGYGHSDSRRWRLASPNTMWFASPISQAFAVVAVMQLHEDGELDANRRASVYIPELPDTWNSITVLQLLCHTPGLPDYRRVSKFSPDTPWTFDALLQLAARNPLHLVPGTDMEQSATNFLLSTEIIERVNGLSYHDSVTKRQTEFLGLGYTGFKKDLGQFHHEDVPRTADIHQLLKKDRLCVNPTGPAISYDSSGTPSTATETMALWGFPNIWTSVQDILLWDVGLTGFVLVHQPENHALMHAPWNLPDGRTVPAASGWQFYRHRGFMNIKESIRGYSSFLSCFIDASKLVCVTLICNKEGVDFTNLGRRVAGACGDLLFIGYDDNRLYSLEGQFPATETVSRLESALKDRSIPVFTKLDHGQNAAGTGLFLRLTTVLVFGSPQVDTGLMEEDQSVSLELPLHISTWEDEVGSAWLAFPCLSKVSDEYGLGNHPVAPKMQNLLEQLVHIGGSIY